MATWMEIRCDLQSQPKSYSNRCWSFDNKGPHGMAADDQKSVLNVLRALNEEAKRTGWVRTREGWVCPHCASQSSKKGE